jgi:ketosteroid isomerase-like protein
MGKRVWLGVSLVFGAALATGAVTEMFLMVQDVYAEHKAMKSAPAWVGHPNPNAIEQPKLETKHELFSEDHTEDVVAIEQVWAAYSYYNDTMNGAGMASLFTPDGVDQHFWDDHGKLIPDFGIVAPGDETKNMTPEGELGSGCVLRGRAQIEYYFGKKRVPEPIAWPGHTHHETPSIMVKVADDGQTAVMTAPFVVAGQNDKGEGHLATGGYRAFFKKTAEGWEIVELYAINDHPAVTQGCDVNGPIGMPS